MCVRPPLLCPGDAVASAEEDGDWLLVSLVLSPSGGGGLISGAASNAVNRKAASPGGSAGEEEEGELGEDVLEGALLRARVWGHMQKQ